MSVVSLAGVIGKSEILARLRKDLLNMQGGKPGAISMATEIKLGPVNTAFAEGLFPLGAVHEFLCDGSEDRAATIGFVSVILKTLMNEGGVMLWISASKTLFAPALVSLGIAPERIIFVQLPREKDRLYAMEEALKCSAITSVLCELSELSFTSSRRLQLAVEQSKVTGFVVRSNWRQLGSTTCVTRWKITSLPAVPIGNLPGIGLPAWSVELLKVRNGKPGSWQLQWEDEILTAIDQSEVAEGNHQRKTG